LPLMVVAFYTCAVRRYPKKSRCIFLLFISPLLFHRGLNRSLSRSLLTLLLHRSISRSLSFSFCLGLFCPFAGALLTLDTHLCGPQASVAEARDSHERARVLARHHITVQSRHHPSLRPRASSDSRIPACSQSLSRACRVAETQDAGNRLLQQICCQTSAAPLPVQRRPTREASGGGGDVPQALQAGRHRFSKVL